MQAYIDPQFYPSLEQMVTSYLALRERSPACIRHTEFLTDAQIIKLVNSCRGSLEGALTEISALLPYNYPREMALFIFHVTGGQRLFLSEDEVKPIVYFYQNLEEALTAFEAYGNFDSDEGGISDDMRQIQEVPLKYQPIRSVVEFWSWQVNQAGAPEDIPREINIALGRLLGISELAVYIFSSLGMALTSSDTLYEIQIQTIDAFRALEKEIATLVE